MKKLTPLQLFTLMVCARSFSMMTYFPFSYNNAFIYMAGVLISTLFQAVLVIPLIIFQKRCQNDNPCTLSMAKNRFFGTVITLIYLLFFLIGAFFIIGDFTYFMDYYFANYIPRIMAVICCTLAAIYLGKMNIQIIGKTGAVAGTLFLALTVVIVLGSFSHLRFENFHLAADNISSSIWQAARSEFARNRDLVALVILLPNIKGKAETTVSWYLIVKLVVLEVILAFITIILGDYAMVTKLPFFALASYSRTDIIERYDAAFMSIWVILALIKLGLYLHCGAKCVAVLFPKANFFWSTSVLGAVSAMCALFVLIPHRWETLAYYDGGGSFIIILAAVIPLILLLCRKGGFSSEKP